MLIFYRLLDLWFAVMDWSQSGDGNITFQRPTATGVGLPEGLYLHHNTEAELRKHILNSLIHTHVNTSPSSHTSLRLHSSSCGASTSGRPPQSNRLSNGGCWVTCFPASYWQLYAFLFLTVAFVLSGLVCSFWSSSFKCRLLLSKMLFCTSSESVHFRKKHFEEQRLNKSLFYFYFDMTPAILRHFYSLYYIANPEFKHARQPMKLKAIFMHQHK